MLAAVPSAGLFVSVAPALAPTPMSQRRCSSQSQTGWPPTVREIGGGVGVGASDSCPCSPARTQADPRAEPTNHLWGCLCLCVRRVERVEERRHVSSEARRKCHVSRSPPIKERGKNRGEEVRHLVILSLSRGLDGGCSIIDVGIAALHEALIINLTNGRDPPGSPEKQASCFTEGRGPLTAWQDETVDSRPRALALACHQLLCLRATFQETNHFRHLF